MNSTICRWTVIAGVTAGSSGCLLAAAGAGAGGAIYVTDRGVESVVAQPVDRVFEATKSAFKELGVTETKSSNEQEGTAEKRSVTGSANDREVTVNLKTESSGTHVEVVAKKSAVTWDKKFARTVLDKVVALSK